MAIHFHAELAPFQTRGTHFWVAAVLLDDLWRVMSGDVIDSVYILWSEH